LSHVQNMLPILNLYLFLMCTMVTVSFSSTASRLGTSQRHFSGSSGLAAK